MVHVCDSKRNSKGGPHLTFSLRLKISTPFDVDIDLTALVP